MTITGRAGLVALVLIAFVAVTPSPNWTLLAVNIVLLVLIALDVLLAGSPKRLSLTRANASSTESTASRTTTGPNTSSQDTFASAGTSVSTVGA